MANALLCTVCNSQPHDHKSKAHSSVEEAARTVSRLVKSGDFLRAELFVSVLKKLLREHRQ